MTFPTDPLVVLIHGAGHDRRIWWAVTLGLSRLGWQVSAPDLPGHGADERAPCPTIEEYAAALAAGLDAERPVVAVGHSMGSLVALELAARLGERCRGLALIGTALPMAVSPELLERAAEPRAACQLMEPWAFGARARGTGLPRAVQELVLEQRPGVLANDLRACNAYAAEPALERAKGMTAPALFLTGAQDRMTPVKAAARLWETLARREAACTWHTLPGVGHTPMLEAPLALRWLLHRFLRRCR